MGFVERLIEQKAAMALAKQQRADNLAAEQELKYNAQQQREAQEESVHQQRRQQAETFRQESGIGLLVAGLGEFLSTEVSSSLIYNDGWLVFSPSDQDSMFDVLDWHSRIVVQGRESKDANFFGTYSIYERKFIAVETRPDGDIKFHAGWFGSTVKRSSWSGNKNRGELLDQALESAFHHPRTYLLKINHIKAEPNID